MSAGDDFAWAMGIGTLISLAMVEWMARDSAKRNKRKD